MPPDSSSTTHDPAADTTAGPNGDDVREHWEAGSREAADAAREADHHDGLPGPTGVVASSGVGHVTLDWDPVEGAIGYQVLRGEDPDDLVVLDHGGGDLLAVPRAPYVDTTGDPGRTLHYAVASLATVEGGHGPVGDAVTAAASDAGDTPARVSARVDATAATTPLQRPWWMVGAEHVSHLLAGGGDGPDPIGEEYAAALGRMHDDVGVTHVRAHAVLDDDNGVVVVDDDGELRVDATAVLRHYDQLADLGLRPVVELGFMPAALAADPDRTVFTYEGIISPPSDWAAWGRVIEEFVTALVDHAGIEEVRRWPFEVWNEPNLGVFWSGSPEEYLRLYEVTVRAVRAVDEQLLVGGPATAAVGWIGRFLDHVVDADLPLDFLTTHVYGVPPLDLRPALATRDLDDVAVWWTEWGITPTHFLPLNDEPFGAPFVLGGMKAAADVADALAYWTATDHFEELGRPPSLLHGGFGLQTVGNLRKPRYWALALAAQQGDGQLPLALDGDGAGGLVDGWATRHDDGTVDVLVWNGTLDQSRGAGHAPLDRRLVVEVRGVGDAAGVAVARIDRDHSNIAAHVDRARDWPDRDGWEALAEVDRLDVEQLGTVTADDGVVTVDLLLPMPGVARIRITPVD